MENNNERAQIFNRFKDDMNALIDREGENLSRLIDAEVIKLMFKMADNNISTCLSFGGFDYIISVKKTPTK